MVVMNDDGMHNLLSSKFKIGADASAAAGPVGRHAGADTDWKECYSNVNRHAKNWP